MALKIITDTSCDLPDQELEKYGIEMIPLKVTFDNGETFLDRYEIPPQEFVKKMACSKTLPKTSAPDPNTFAEYFERGLKEAGEVLFVSISSGLSSTYQTACLACDLLNTKRVKVFDTLTASMGTGIMAIKAAQLADKGIEILEILENLKNIRSQREVIFTLDTLDNVVKGGRLSKIEGMAGNLLNIKPILRGNMVGVPEIVGKVRGRKKALQRILNMIEEFGGRSISNKIVGVSHVNCEDEAIKLMEQIRVRFNPAQILISEMSATVGTYAGEGGLMVNF